MRPKMIKLLIGLFAMGLAATTAQAGEINAAEQSIVNAVSQAFEYNGKTYIVKSAYIAEGRAKLAQDKVNLSSGEASDYISQFHGAKGELVSEGYCDEIITEDKKDSQANNTSANNAENPLKSTVEPEKTSSPQEAKIKKAFLQSFLGKPTKVADDKNEQDNKTDVSPQSTATPAVEEEWNQEEDLGVVQEFTEQDTESAAVGNVEIQSGNESYVVQKEDEKKSNFIDQLSFLGIQKVVFFVVLGLSVVTLAGIVIYIKKIKKRKKKNRKLRTGLAISMGICVTGWMLLILMSFSVYFGLYNKDAIHRQMMESDYFSGVTQMTRELAGQELEKAGYNQEIASEVFTLSNVYIKEKQYIDAVLSGDMEAEISTEVIREDLEEQIVDEDSEKKEDVITSLENVYKNMLQFQLGKEIYEGRKDFLPWFYACVIVGCIMLVGFAVAASEMYGYLHKAVRIESVGIAIASVVVIAISMLARVKGLAWQIVVSPIYYQQFLQKFVAWDIKVMLYVGLLGMLTAVALFVWKRYLHMIYVE